ncbi:uncharacterized membrane protein (DUF106 family) [Anaerosolibacter carboniphilus]|uniref:Uncharacterized membrane protein (DUF106 family) n=1 Tax=Anaerosolibacter carboniphilus TaxID=1417629 RepID=A0A841KVW4_9FIRM|nr:hypothetical protein [Anaerosolibacter carboniphilus]MBB6217507.1 uncharacterized membrane protein (DUF106 family) [Anaerosolibacter carboniphilus]
MKDVFVKKINKKTIVVKPSLEEIKKEFLKRIKEAQLLGDTSEVEKLQQEYLIKKVEYETV